jgi:ATP-dependent Clp protease ATP-binding subunit ClpC
MDEAAARVRIRAGRALEHGPTSAQTCPMARVEPEDVAQVLSTWTGIPVSSMTADESRRLLELEQVLAQQVVGQEAGVCALARAIRRSRSGLQEEGRPVGSFLFAGPSGVGKTQLSRALARALFDSEDNLLRLDMSEFSEAHSVSRLIGSPPGYVGHETGGQLTEQIRKHPYCVVLFDEVEKATDAVWNLLLQILEDGALTDAQGKKADFRNAVLILTTNLGSDLWRSHPLGFGVSRLPDQQQAVEAALRQTFRPELLNRLDEIICFAPLNHRQAREIARRMVAKTGKQLERKGVALALEDSALEVMARQCADPEYGARPLRRFLRRELEDPAAQALLEGRLCAGRRLRLLGEGEHLKLAIEVDADKKTASEPKTPKPKGGGQMISLASI